MSNSAKSMIQPASAERKDDIFYFLPESNAIRKICLTCKGKRSKTLDGDQIGIASAL